MNDILSKVSKVVEETSKKPANIFGYSAWTHHILNVAKFSKQLAHQFGADPEVAEMCALLHDYASVSNEDWYQEHHIHSARLARELLKKYEYPEEKIKEVEEAILAHRGSRTIERKSIQAQILADADAMAHFTSIDSLFYLAFVRRGMDINQGTAFLTDKLERSWLKLSPEAKKICQPYYKAAKKLFEVK